MDITNKLDQILTNINNINLKIDKITSDINALNNKINIFGSQSGYGIKSIKFEKIELEKNIIIQNLNLRSTLGDISLIKRIYFDCDKNLYPIHFKNKNLEYFYDGLWHEDDCNYIKDTLIKILKYLYTSINIVDNYNDNDCDTFLNNQLHIGKLNDESYKTKVINELKIFLKQA